MIAVGTTQPGSLTPTFCPRMLWKAKGHWISRTNENESTEIAEIVSGRGCL